MSNTKIVTDRTVDDPILQSAKFQYDKLDRAYVDAQILGTQQHVVDNLISGYTATWYTVSSDSAACAVGDIVCLAGSTIDAFFITRATPAALAAAKRPLGICLTSASPTTDVRVAILGVLPPSITGLVASASLQSVRVSSTARCEQVASFTSGDFPIGFTDQAGNLNFNCQGATGAGGPLTGDAGGHLTLTYPNPALANGRTTKADLRALTLRADRSEIHIAENNRPYRYDITVGVNVADNGYDCIKPTDVLLASNGRWIGLGETEVPTIAALRTLTSGFSSKVHVRAFATDGDGGGGHFLKRTGTGTDNGGTTIVPSGVTTFWYERQYSGSLDAAWFGVTPSTTGAPLDVTARMQAAISATPSGGSLRIKTCDSTDAAGLRYRLKSIGFTHGSEGAFALTVSRAIRIVGDNAFYNNGAAVGAGVTFQCDAGIGGIFIKGSGGGSDGRFTELGHIAFYGAGGTRSHGIYAEGSTHFDHCACLGFSGIGVFVNGDGGGHNANQCAVNSLVVNQNGEHGWFITGQESNGNSFVGINANENVGVGIWDSSFLGNVYTGCQVALNGSGVIGKSLGGKPLGYASDGGENATVFVGCYTEDSDYHSLSGSTLWIGNRVGAGQVPEGGGRYLHTEASYDIGFRAPNLAAGGGSYYIEFKLAPTTGTSTIMTFQLPDIAAGGTRVRDRYVFGVIDAFIENTSTEGYGFAYANSFAAQPFFMSAEAFYRGAGRMVFGNGFYQRSFASTSSKWFFVNNFPPVTSQNGLAHEVGDTLDFETPVGGVCKGRVCVRAGFYGAPVVRSHVYSVGDKVTPSLDNTHVYSCTTGGTSHATTEPTFNTGSGSTTTDGTAVFTEIGTASLWLNFAPPGQDDLTMLSKSVAAGGTITLTDAESHHERIKFTGAPGGALSVVVSTGYATGWVRTFWNACGQTVTVKGSSGDAGVAVANGATKILLSDGTNVRSAGSDGTNGTNGTNGADATPNLILTTLGSNKTAGYTGAFDLDFIGPWNLMRLTPDAEGRKLILKNASAAVGNFCEVSNPDTTFGFGVYADDGTTLLITIPGMTGNTPGYASFVYKTSGGAGWVVFDPGNSA